MPCKSFIIIIIIIIIISTKPQIHKLGGMSSALSSQYLTKDPDLWKHLEQAPKRTANSHDCQAASESVPPTSASSSQGQMPTLAATPPPKAIERPRVLPGLERRTGTFFPLLFAGLAYWSVAASNPSSIPSTINESGLRLASGLGFGAYV